MSSLNASSTTTSYYQGERILTIDELKRLRYKRLLDREQRELALREKAEEARLEDAKSRLEDAKG